MSVNGQMPNSITDESLLTSSVDDRYGESDQESVNSETLTMTNSESSPLISGLKHNISIPSDRYYFVYMIFYLLGIGSLLPFNFFSNARQYFVFKLRSNVSVSETDWIDEPSQYNNLQSMFVPYLTMAAMVPNVLFMFINTALTKILILWTRIIIAIIAMIVMFTLTVILTKIDTDGWQLVFFGVTIVTIFIMNAGSAVLQGGIFGLSSMFPKEYTQAVMGGMGMGGVIAAVANVIAIWLSEGPMDSGFGYFLTAELVIITAMAGYLSLPCSKFARYFMAGTFRTHHLSINEQPHSEIGASGETLIPITTGCRQLMIVFKKIWIYASCVFLVFLVTLSCFPAITSRIFSTDLDNDNPSAWASKYFIPVTCFLLFNVTDLVGRTLAGLMQWPHEGSILLPVLCILRVVFIPLFLLCNILPHNQLPQYVAFHNDYAPILIMLFFGMSNGYLGTLCMMYGPRVLDPENMEVAGSMMSLFLSLGLAMGSALSFLLISIV
ncbi:hypothetical protein LSH36_587g01005 [Paralvinella palmiformis]|uniref:Equilibrative nucleoside transporter 3 n=1 Tax=Paralvinella palmiformis TaxID=53620 RepID=A0AAD9J5E2_9ANNE|nr:hypothetical protein LSH36_587g01005 [Paralvinella palmiformis]